MTESARGGRSFTVNDTARSNLTRGKLRRLIRTGQAQRLAHGSYALTSDLEHMAVSERYRYAVWRRWNRVQHPVAVVSHVSAAALWDLPLPSPIPTKMHLSGYRPHAGQATRDVIRHAIAVPEADVTERYGMPCTSLDRTVIDVAMSESAETAIMVADTALWLALQDLLDVDELKATETYEREVEQIRERWRRLVKERSGRRGVRQAREIVELADWRSESPGESVTRLRMHEAGMPVPELQVPVQSPHGTLYRLDFCIKEYQAFIEFDGAAKYDNDPWAAREQLLQEKRREDWIRAKTGWRCVRLTWRDISSPERFRTVMIQHGLL